MRRDVLAQPSLPVNSSGTNSAARMLDSGARRERVGEDGRRGGDPYGAGYALLFLRAAALAARICSIPVDG